MIDYKEKYLKYKKKYVEAKYGGGVENEEVGLFKKMWHLVLHQRKIMLVNVRKNIII